MTTDDQRLWLCRWGTQSALVWATSAYNAEVRVRHACWDRKARLGDIRRRPQRVFGEVRVLREATDEDRECFVEAGGTVPT